MSGAALTMAHAPETGFYFEPLTERLALVVEGSPFPTDDHWAYVGDPIEMSPELARLECANRWPGVDPESLDVEFDLDFERAAAELEKQRMEQAAGIVHQASELDFDLDVLLAQAEALRRATDSTPDTPDDPDPSETIGQAIERASKEGAD